LQLLVRDGELGLRFFDSYVASQCDFPRLSDYGVGFSLLSGQFVELL
jgi:hypothetical protein